MDELTSRIASCSGVASTASTIASRRPSAERTMRPYARVSGGANESTVAAAPSLRWVSRSARSNSVVSSGVSPESTSTSPLCPSRRVRAERTASPVPSGCSCTATSFPSNAARLSGDVTITSGCGSSARAASTTQSSSRRPSSPCRCFGVADRMRVQRPAAITTAARLLGIWAMAGAPGFEPGIAGPKPAALPLGYAPPEHHGNEAPTRAQILAPVGEDEKERDRREDHDRDDRRPEDDEREDRDQHGEQLRDRENPGHLAE